MGDCIACVGSGQKSRGGECVPCNGTGTLPGGVVLPQQRNPALPQHSSESVECYTPADLVEPSRTLMGWIDLDPASCELAKRVVKATAWYGPGSPFGEDGLVEPWLGRVFLNPPGGTTKGHSNAAIWWARLANLWQSGDVEQAIFIGFTLEILRSAQNQDCPQPLDFPMCVPRSRTDFETENRIRTKGKKAGELIDPSQPVGARVKQGAPAHANVIVYLPNLGPASRKLSCGYTKWDGDPFVEAFKEIGRCRV